MDAAKQGVRTLAAAALLCLPLAGSGEPVEDAKAGGDVGFVQSISIDVRHFQAEALKADAPGVPEAQAPTGTLDDLLPRVPPPPEATAGSAYRRIRSDDPLAGYKDMVRQVVADSLAKLFPSSGKMDIGLADSKYGPLLIGKAFWDEGGWGYGALFDVHAGAPVRLKYVFVTPLDGDKNRIPKTPAELIAKVNALSRLRIQDAQEEEFQGRKRPFKAFEGGRARVTVSYDPVFDNYFPPEVGAVMFMLLNGADLGHLARQ